MTTWQGKTKGGLLGYKIFIYLLKNAGIGAAYLLLSLVAMYYTIFAFKASSSIYYYFRNIHQLPKAKAARSVYRNFYIFGQTLIDKVALIAGIENRFTYNFEGEHHLHEIKSRGKGGILISAHLGNWDIAGFLLKRLNWKINIVMYEAERAQIKKYMDEVMGERQFNIIPIKNDLSHIFLINSALNNNEIVCLHGDRFVEGSQAVQKTFMGKPAYFPTGPFSIASKLQVPYAFVYALKEDKYHYHFFSTPLQEDSRSTDDILNDYIESLEEKIHQYPLQWFNYYDFWSTKVKGADIKSTTS